MLTKSKLALTAAICLAGVAGMNIAIVYLTRNTVPRRLMRHVRESESAVVLALGNSLMAAGFDEAAFNATAGLSSSQGAANLGLGASVPASQLLLLRYALAHGIVPHLVLYGFYDFQLTDPTLLTTGDLIGNNAMLNYVEPLYARRFYTLSRHDAFEFRVMHLFPMFDDRGAAWTKIEILRRALAQQGMPPERNNQFGRTSDFSLLESANTDDFRSKCEASMGLPVSPAIREIIRQSKQAGATVTVIEMPMTAKHRELFYDTGCWSDYASHLKDLLGQDGADFIDSSAWIENDELFEDALHLSSSGADRFSRRLAGGLSGQLAFGADRAKLP